MRIALYSAAVATALLASTAAHAANGSRPRTQPIWEPPPCIEVVDKTQTPVFHAEYSVLQDELELTDDELSDSRRHQFFAFRKAAFDYALPTYINQSDHDRAEANGDNSMSYGPQDILESSPVWPEGSYVRITPDDPRVPITLERAAMGIDWDLTDVEVGPYLISGYTWEPEQNAWSWRMGLVQVIDPAQPREEGPAVFGLTELGMTAFAGDEITISTCIDAPEGARLTLAWGVLTGNEAPTWKRFLEDEAVTTGEQDLAFTIPAEANNSLLKFRFEIEDDQGRAYTAFTPFPMEVLDDGSGSSTTSDGESGDDMGDDTTPGESDTANQDGFGDVGCRAGGTPALLGLLWLPLLFARRREDD